MTLFSDRALFCWIFGCFFSFFFQRWVRRKMFERWQGQLPTILYDFLFVGHIVCYPFPVARRPQYHQRPIVIVIVPAGFWRWKLQGGAVKTVGSAVFDINRMAFAGEVSCFNLFLFLVLRLVGAWTQWVFLRPSYLSMPTHGFTSLWAESVGRRICLEGTRG